MELTSINPDELRNRLSGGTTQFAFHKVDGSLRIAIGTTNLTQVPQEFHPKGGDSSDKTVTYFDLQKMGWRSVSIHKPIFIQQ